MMYSLLNVNRALVDYRLRYAAHIKALYFFAVFNFCFLKLNGALYLCVACFHDICSRFMSLL